MSSEYPNLGLDEGEEDEHGDGLAVQSKGFGLGLGVRRSMSKGSRVSAFGTVRTSLLPSLWLLSVGTWSFEWAGARWLVAPKVCTRGSMPREHIDCRHCVRRAILFFISSFSFSSSVFFFRRFLICDLLCDRMNVLSSLVLPRLRLSSTANSLKHWPISLRLSLSRFSLRFLRSLSGRGVLPLGRIDREGHLAFPSHCCRVESNLASVVEIGTGRSSASTIRSDAWRLDQKASLPSNWSDRLRFCFRCFLAGGGMLDL
mmetsp:Transcript_23544/g.43992  ORF Transcript_23544/g.43992 Transcript_23544/m.43992 type:complete len:258 (+) Transcript_23544:348-1121(+)